MIIRNARSVIPASPGDSATGLYSINHYGFLGNRFGRLVSMHAQLIHILDGVQGAPQEVMAAFILRLAGEEAPAVTRYEENIGLLAVFRKDLIELNTQLPAELQDAAQEVVGRLEHFEEKARLFFEIEGGWRLRGSLFGAVCRSLEPKSELEAFSRAMNVMVRKIEQAPRRARVKVERIRQTLEASVASLIHPLFVLDDREEIVLSNPAGRLLQPLRGGSGDPHKYPGGYGNSRGNAAKSPRSQSHRRIDHVFSIC